MPTISEKKEKGMKERMEDTIGSRIYMLRKEQGLSMKALAKKTWTSCSRISRLETGKIRTMDSDSLFIFAVVLGVSADYLLGITTIRSQKQIDVERLGFSEEAIRRIMDGRCDMDQINFWIEHPQYKCLSALTEFFMREEEEEENKIIKFQAGWKE